MKEFKLVEQLPRFDSPSLPVTRRTLVQMSAVGAMFAALATLVSRDVAAQESVDEIVIDLETEPPTLDPALANDLNAWSVVHSIHDSVVHIAADGSVEPLLATKVEFTNPRVLRIELPADRTFHDGSPVDAESVQRALAHIRNPDVASQIVDNFSRIETVRIVDSLTIEFGLSAPAPYLLAQLAPWLTPIPESTIPTIGTAPIGAGPYRFVSWSPGESLELEANPDYPADSPKGRPIAQRVRFRFVPESTTRVADLLSGGADIVRAVQPDQIAAIEDAGAQVITQPVTGISFVRIVNNVEPFTSPDVRRAMNFAVDVPAIVDALNHGYGAPLASLFPEGGLGYDPDLDPIPYDPDQARSLLAAAGYPDGFEVDFEHTTDTRLDVIEAVAAMLGDVGIRVTLKPVELATFNATWKESAPLRYISWRPLNDPFTLLNLVVNENGFLSSFSSPAVQGLIEEAAEESDPERRAQLYRDLSRALQEDPPAIFLSSLVAHYGVAADAPAFTTRPDDWTLPTLRSE
jgi:peptide/nickel transport system substrate-binding protein